jgi:hypothetical protein
MYFLLYRIHSYGSSGEDDGEEATIMVAAIWGLDWQQRWVSVDDS